MTAHNTNLHAALEFRRRGWYPVPLCWPRTEGLCGCFKEHAGRDVGKAPILGDGYQDLRPDESMIRQWWEQWPQANIGLLLKPSGLLFVGPDNPASVEWVKRQGLPPTTVRISKNPAYLYERPNDCPAATTKYKEAGIEVDLKGNGYCVAYGRHKEGHSIYLDLGDPAPAPPWVVPMLARRNGHGTSQPPRAMNFNHLAQAVNALDRLSPRRADDYDSWVQVGMALSELGDVGLVLWDPWSQQSGKHQPGECASKWRSFEPGHGLTLGSLVHWAREDTKGNNEAGVETENLTSNHRDGPCEVRLREVDATQLISLEGPGTLESLELLGQGGYVIQQWGHIVSGYPKAGKTELLFRCVRDWLNEGMGPVLWLSEESETVWKHRLMKYPDFPQGLRLVFALGEKPEALLNRAKTGIEPIVIVDTIRNLLGINDEADNALIARTLGGWEASLHMKTRIYAHHDRKAAGEHGQAIAGGAGFLGVVDRAIELRFDPQNNKRRRRLCVHSRIQEAADLVYEMGEGGALHALGNPEQVSVEETGQRALQVLKGEWSTTDEVLESIGHPKPSKQQLRNALHAQCEAGTVERDPKETRQGATYKWRLHKT